MSTLWTQAMSHLAMPWLVHRDEGYMAGRAKHVKDAGFAGFVQHPTYKAHVDKGYASGKYHDEHLYDSVEPEPSDDDFHHLMQHGEFTPEHRAKHYEAYQTEMKKRQDRDTPDHTDHHLISFQRSDALFKENWEKHGTLGPVDIRGPVHATQSHVNQAHVDRYLANPKDKSWHEQTTGLEPGEYEGGRHPLFVSHQGRLHVIEGHHRVAAALQAGHTHVHGWHMSLEAYHHATGQGPGQTPDQATQPWR